MSKCLIKGYRVVQKESEPLIVDTNELIAKRMEEIVSLSSGEKGGFQSGLNAPQIEALPGEEEDVEGVNSEQVQVVQPVYTGPSPDELLAEAQAEIEAMQKQAMEEIELLKKHTAEEGRQEGYQEGQKQAVQELEQEKQVLKQKAAQMEMEYQDRISRLEPKFIETITGIYEQIFRVDLADYKPILLHAISNSIRNIEGGKDFIIHVSREDYAAVSAAKEQLFAGLLTTSASMEIIEDITLGENQCMIETSNGIYDCSIGSQLEELGRRLCLLSYEK